MVLVKLLFFARAREVVNASEKEVTLSPGPYTSQTLLEDIINHCEELKALANSIMLALNEEYIDQSSRFYLNDGDCVAIIPPLSGG